MNNQPNKQIKIAVVGDVHDQWELEDAIALEKLGIDLVLFVGDFGNESLEVVAKIAQIKLPMATIMGNHDAWYTASDWGRKKSPYDHSKEDRVSKQLELLGKSHVGYGIVNFPELNISVVGSRPFSWGGPEWRNKQFYRDRYQVNNFEESTAKIVAAANQATCENLIILGHNGPWGLGDRPFDSCGRDWNPTGGDYGDPDLTEAIKQIHSMNKCLNLVTFGHMHHRVKNNHSRIRQVINQDQKGTIYFNCASVPRIITTNTGKQRNFSLIDWQQGTIKEISLVWLGEDYSIISQQVFYQRKTRYSIV